MTSERLNQRAGHDDATHLGELPPWLPEERLAPLRGLQLVITGAAWQQTASLEIARAARARGLRVRPVGGAGAGSGLRLAWSLGFRDVLPAPLCHGEHLDLKREWLLSPRWSEPAAVTRAPNSSLQGHLWADDTCDWRTAEQVAADNRLAERTLRRRMQRAWGVSAREFSARLRADIRDYLLLAGVPLGEVAAGIGYAQVASLHRAIKRETTESASEWQRSLRERAAPREPYGQPVGGCGRGAPVEAEPKDPASPPQPDSPAR